MGHQSKDVRARSTRSRARKRWRQDAVERAEWVECSAEAEYGFSVREHVLTRRPPKLTTETLIAARASLARREPVTPPGAAYVVWLAATDPDGLAQFWHDAVLADRDPVRGTFDEMWDRGFLRLEFAARREARRIARRPSTCAPALVRRSSPTVRRGRAGRRGRTRRSAVSRDDGSGLDDPDSDGPAARADARLLPLAGRPEACR